MGSPGASGTSTAVERPLLHGTQLSSQQPVTTYGATNAPSDPEDARPDETPLEDDRSAEWRCERIHVHPVVQICGVAVGVFVVELFLHHSGIWRCPC